MAPRAAVEVKLEGLPTGEIAALGRVGEGAPRRAARPRGEGTPSSWLGRGEHLGLAFRAARGITRRMPTALRYCLADLGGEAAYRLLRRRAAIATENYRVFRPGDAAATERLTRRAFRNYARTVLDFLVLEQLLDQLRGSPGAVSSDPLGHAFERGTGAIVVTPHFGNWDLGAAVTATWGRPVHAVADRFGPPAVDRLVRATRERLGVRVIPTGPSSAREALRALRRGEVLCLAADIDKAGAGVPVTFLGRRVYLPAGPATLSLRTGASLIPGYARRLPQGGHEARLLEPLLPSGSGGEAAVVELTQRMADAFERMIRIDPGQWFAFHHLVGGGAAGEHLP